MNELKAVRPVTAGNVTLLPIERLSIHSGKKDLGCWIAAQNEPYAIIILDSCGIRAFDMEGNDISIETLAQEIPDLGATLNSIDHDAHRSH